MEKWQSLGYTSFGEWRRASERARREAKKAAGVSPAIVQWKLAQSLPAPAPPSPLARPRSPERGGQLPGQLHEEVITTPRGRRKHKLKHTSPDGTTRNDEYVSPAGVQQQVCQERSACWRRLVAARRAETQARILGCGECASCLEYAAYRESENPAQAPACVVRNDRCQAVGFKRKPVLEMTPSQAKYSRLNYGMCERL